MIAAINLNPELDLNLLSFPEFDTSSLPSAFIKYQRVEKVINQLPQPITNIVNQMLGLFKQNCKSKILIDYKVKNLKKGQPGCSIAGWHLDYTENPNRSEPLEEHLIFSTHVGTEFITTPMVVLPEDTHFTSIIKRNNSFDYIAVKPNTVTKYSRLNLHRGPIIIEDCRRVVIRLTKINEI